MMPLRATALLMLAAMATSCASSPPVQFFTLDPTPPGNPHAESAHAPAPAAVPLQVARVRIPPTLDRQQIVRETAPYALDINDQHRWSAPLDQMIEHTLQLDLQQLLPAHSVVPAQAPAVANVAKLVVDIDRFMTVPSGNAELIGSWSVTSADGNSSCSHEVALSQRPESASYADQVKAMSALVAKLADNIAAASRGPSPPSNCSR